NPPPQVALEAIVATSFEVFYLQLRRNIDAPLASLTPQLARLSLVPFLGAVEVDQLIQTKLRDAAITTPASALTQRSDSQK
ncbi:MAG TPA: hypothetical protein VK680_13405, partial [Solirubrobacteraceae bacterium]|nr:hypothetical protein [Solirubrobacteraceae bacterium]